MSDTKPWYTSKTVWAAAATILVGVLGLFKRGVDPHFVDDFSSWAVSASTLVSGAVAACPPCAAYSASRARYYILSAKPVMIVLPAAPLPMNNRQ